MKTPITLSKSITNGFKNLYITEDDQTGLYELYLSNGTPPYTPYTFYDKGEIIAFLDGYKLAKTTITNQLLDLLTKG